MTRGRRGGGRSGAARAKPPSLGALRRRLEAFCRSLPGVTADVKWGHELVFSVGGKMFAGFDAAGGDGVGFKTEPMLFAALIKKRGIRPAPYAARFHWVSVESLRTLPIEMLEQLLRESYLLVREKLPRRVRRELGFE